MDCVKQSLKGQELESDSGVKCKVLSGKDLLEYTGHVCVHTPGLAKAGWRFQDPVEIAVFISDSFTKNKRTKNKQKILKKMILLKNAE